MVDVMKVSQESAAFTVLANSTPSAEGRTAAHLAVRGGRRWTSVNVTALLGT